jgi:hypothetical protein
MHDLIMHNNAWLEAGTNVEHKDYAYILISYNAYQPIHNLAGYALLDALVPIQKWKEKGLNLVKFDVYII